MASLSTTRDLTAGTPTRDLTDRPLQGEVRGEEVLLVKRDSEIFAVGARCPHYGGPLAEGVIGGESIRCPWHHACFSLRTGEAVRAPALDPIACWRLEQNGDRVFVREKLPAPSAKSA